MARDTRPKLKYMNRFGMLPEGTTIRKRRKQKKTDYGLRLEEKQKLKFIYGIMERQLKKYVREALRKSGDPKIIILQQLETRLDNIVYRLGLAPTRVSAKQLVSHGHISVDGHKVTIPSYQVRPGQTLAVKEKIYKAMKEFPEDSKPAIPSWLERKNAKGSILRIPEKDELPQEVNMNYVVELYS